MKGLLLTDVIGASDGTGLLGTLLAAHRQERVLAVDAGGSDGPLNS